MLSHNMVIESLYVYHESSNNGPTKVIFAEEVPIQVPQKISLTLFLNQNN